MRVVKQFQFNHFDLNLLRVFQAILATASVSGAGERLGTTQSAVSHTLKRLRDICGDALFVRTAEGMEPTPYALEIAGPIQAALDQIRHVLETRQEFSPATSQRTLNIALSDMGQVSYLPKLTAHIHAAAPGCKIVVHPFTRHSLQEQMQAGRIDLAIGLLPGLQTGFHQRYLYQDDFVCAVRTDHPRISKRITLQQFVSEGHVIAAPVGTGPNQVDSLLGKQKLKRRVVLQVPNFLSAAPVVGTSDLIAVLPRRVGMIQTPGVALNLLPLPFVIPAFSVYQFWHERLHRDAGHRWLRGVVNETLGK